MNFGEFEKILPSLAIAFIDGFLNSWQILLTLLPAGVMEDVVRIAKGFRLIGIFGGPGFPSIIAVEGFQMIPWSHVSSARAVEELLRVKQQPDTGQAIDVADNRYQLYGLACIGYGNFTSGEARRVDQTQQSLEYSYDRHLL